MHSAEVFWYLAGALSALAANFILWPLLRGPATLGAGTLLARDGAGASRLTMLRSGPVPYVLVLALAAPVTLYYLGRDEHGLAASISAAAPAPAASADRHGGSMDAELAKLEQRLARQGGSDADWQLLASTYDYIGRPDDATAARTRHVVASATARTPASAVAAQAPAPTPAEAAEVATLRAQLSRARRVQDVPEAQKLLARLAALGALDAQGWADYADVAGMAAGGHLTGEPEKFIDQALALDASNLKALWLKASAQHEGRRYGEAVATWQRLLKLPGATVADTRIFTANLREDQALAAQAPAAAPAGSAAPGGGVAITGSVSLAGAISGRVPAGATLFVFARAPDGPPMPVAVQRLSVARWPVSFRLDDASALMPGRTLSGVGRVLVQARVSASGDAAAHAGDLVSGALVVDPRASPPLTLLIDQAVP